MTITTYTNTADKFILDKTNYLTIVDSAVSIALKDDTNIISPVLIISNVLDPDINYCYIAEFGRYYYITNITGDAGNRAFVHGHVDVLMTYKDEIKACKCIANRSTSNYNLYL